MTTTLITGPTSGIGYELAKLCANNQHNLVLVGRDPDKLAVVAQELKKIAPIRISVIVEDLGKPGAADRIARICAQHKIIVDHLMNNAGFGLHGTFANTHGTIERDMLQVNCAALTELTKVFLPGMIERGHGRIMNVGSIAGFFPGPLMSVYFATKAYVLSFSLALAEELRGTGVTVTAFCPGGTKTAFSQRAQTPATSMINNGMDAATVARIGYNGMLRGKQIVIPGIANKFLPLLGRLLPRSVIARIIHRLSR